ncbi:MAG: alpha/beta hydrolase-fold protein [Flavobacteriaceae bacterium]
MQKLGYILLLSLLIFSCKNEKAKEPVVEKKDPMGTVLVEGAVLAGGKLMRIDSFPTKLVIPRTVDVWLPDGYSEEKKYAVLYMHDGQNLFDATKTWNKQEWKVDEIISDLIKKDTIRDVLVVAVWNNSDTRWQDYFPQKAFSYLSEKDSIMIVEDAKKNNFDTNLMADNYLKFLVEEVKPYIDNQYATLTDYKNTFVAGSSMGGLISMYAICEYPQVFGGAACVSTHWPGIMPSDNNPMPEAIFKYMQTNLPSPQTHKFYFDYGTETLDEYYPRYLDDVDKIFFSKGYDETNYMNLEFAGADHSEDSWNRRFDIPLIFLLGKNK